MNMILGNFLLSGSRKQGIISVGMAYKLPSLASNLVVIWFEECKYRLFISHSLKRRMMKTAIQECITFNEPRN